MNSSKPGPYGVAAFLALVGGIVFVGVWLLYLYHATAGQAAPAEAAGGALAAAFDPGSPGLAFVVATLLSIVGCCVAAALLWWRKPRLGLGVTLCHAGAAVALYPWGLALAIGLPLLLTPELLRARASAEATGNAD